VVGRGEEKMHREEEKRRNIDGKMHGRFKIIIKGR